MNVLFHLGLCSHCTVILSAFITTMFFVYVSLGKTPNFAIVNLPCKSNRLSLAWSPQLRHRLRAQARLQIHEELLVIESGQEDPSTQHLGQGHQQKQQQCQQSYCIFFNSPPPSYCEVPHSKPIDVGLQQLPRLTHGKQCL